MEKQSISEEYEYALEALNDSRIRESKEFKAWIGDEAHRKLFAELSDYREATMNLQKEISPDTEQAWERFSTRIKPRPSFIKKKVSHKQIMIWSCGIAAALLIIVWLALPTFTGKKTTGTQVAAIFPALDEPQEVVLHTDKGLTFTLNSRQNEETIKQVGAEVNEQEEVLRYHQTEEEKIAMHTLTTPRGKDFKVVLDDGTKVWLNAESCLRYPIKFTEKERIVELEGEAFFQVAKDETHPFVVKSNGTEARVLGTQFNFRAYAEESRHITLVSGSVKVSDPVSTNELILQPGQDVLLGEETLRPREVDVEEYTAWTKGLFYFDNTTLTEIMKTVGRWYNLTIIFTDEAAMHYHFSFWADRKETPLQTIERLNRVGKVKAVLEDEQIIISQ